MIISFGTDHSGFPMKSEVLSILKDEGIEVIDHGSYTPERVDFPDITKKVCDSILRGDADRGLILCGSGVGACIAANKIPGIRAALCHEIYSAHQCVEHDDVNVLCMGGKIVGPWLAKDIIHAFIRAEFSKDEYFRQRIKKLEAMELDAAREWMGRRE